MFDLEDQLDHAPGDKTENDLTIFLGSLIQATDFDGDTAPGGAVQIVVNDDTPIATAGTSTGTVDEDGVVEGAADAGPGDGIARRRRRRCRRGRGCDGLGDGAVPVWRGRAADLWLSRQCGYDVAALGLTSGGVALSYAVIGCGTR